MANQTTGILLFLLLVLLLGITAGWISGQLKVPDIVLFLVFGLAAGPSGVGLINIAGSPLGQAIVTFGALFMLYEGGRSLRVPILKEIWRTVALLATLGVAITAGVVAVAVHTFFGVSWFVSLLAAATVAPTDPAAIIPLLQQVRISPRLSHLAKAEAAFNDATGAVILFVLLALGKPQGVTALGAGLKFITMVGGGIGIGLLVSLLASYLVSEGHRVAKYSRFFRELEHGSLISLIMILASYLLATALGFSGFMAVFVAGIVTGNKHLLGLKSGEEVVRAQDYYFRISSVLVRMLIFVILGSEISFHAVFAMLLPGLAVVMALMLVARPLTAIPIMSLDRPSGWSWPERFFASWVRETGVVPAALASILVAAKVPGSQLTVAVVFLAILITILVQGSTTRTVAQKLGLLESQNQPKA